MESNKTGGTNN